MIRHSSSLFVSLVFHVFLAFSIFLLYTTLWLPKPKKQVQERRIKVQLCNIKIPKAVVEKKVQEVPKPFPKTIQKKEVKELPIIRKKAIKKKKIIEKPKPKPKPKPKIIEKKEPIKQIKKEIQPISKPTPEIEKTIEKVLPIENKETLQEKNTRLEKNYLNEHIQEITRLLQENLYYPRSARKRGIVGDVSIAFTLSVSGKIHSIKILNSKHEILSRAALQTIENISGELPSPQEELTLHVPINYRLSR